MDSIAILKIQLESLSKNLSESSPKDSTQPITKKLATQFNQILERVGEHYPDVKPLLPEPINLTIPQEYGYYDYPDASYFDLKTFADQLISILTHLESGS